MRQPLGAFMVRQAIQQAELAGTTKRIYISLDDTIAAKHQDTRQIRRHWHYDHCTSTKRQPRYINGLTSLICTVAVGTIQVTFDLRECTVLRINRRRVVTQRLRFISKPRLARKILEALRPLLPTGWEVYVQFDSWYASAHLLKYIYRQDWHTVCGFKSNRKLNGKRLNQQAHASQYQE